METDRGGRDRRVFIGAVSLSIGIAEPSDRAFYVWSGVTWLVVGGVNALAFARRRR